MLRDNPESARRESSFWVDEKKGSKKWKLTLARWFWAFFYKKYEKSQKRKLDFEPFSRQNFFKRFQFYHRLEWEDIVCWSWLLKSSWFLRKRRRSSFPSFSSWIFAKIFVFEVFEKIQFSRKVKKVRKRSSKFWSSLKVVSW